MRLGLRIGFFVGLSAVAPLVVLAFAATEVARTQVEARIVDFQVDAAVGLASDVDRAMGDTERVLAQQLANFRLGDASGDARRAFLLTTYRLVPSTAIIALVDLEGRELEAPLYQEAGAVSLGEHEGVSAARLAEFRDRRPLPGPEPGALVVGEPHQPEGARAAALPVVFTSPWGDGVALAVELSLAPLAARTGLAGDSREVALIDGRGAVLARAGAEGLVDAERARPLIGSAAADLRYATAADEEILAAFAAVPGRGWGVMLAEPADTVGAIVGAIRARTWFVGGVALVMALIGGTYLSRSVTAPVLRLRAATTELGRGVFARTDVQGDDELAQLAVAFNQMSDSLARSTAEISAKNKEIEGFNRELQARVDQRTAQLREAQARLVQSGQLAAVGELSAGLAHELNNPLAGILGIVQILGHQLRGRPEAALLKAAEEQAVRCKEIVANLLRFSRSDDTPQPGGVVDVDAVLRDVLALAASALRQRGVDVAIVPASPLLIRGDATQLGRALGQLLTSLRSVAAPGATLEITTATGAAEVELRFGLTHTVPTSDDWRAAGMGFWVARQVFQDHGATLDEPAGERGGARTWRLRAPREAA